MNLSTIRKASERQQAAFKVQNAANDPARTSFDDIDRMLDECHLGRKVRAKDGTATQRATPEELEEAKRLQREFPDRESLARGMG